MSEQLDLIMKMETNNIKRMHNLIKRMESGELTDIEQIGIEMLNYGYKLSVYNNELINIINSNTNMTEYVIVDGKKLNDRIDKIVSLVESNVEAIKISEKIKQRQGRQKTGEDTEIIRLYTEGISLKDIGERLGLSAEAIRCRLIKSGVYVGKKKDYGLRRGINKINKD